MAPKQGPGRMRRRNIGQNTGCRIVVCDDVDDYRAFLEILPERIPGFRVVGHARDGHEAVQVAESQQPDVVLLDVSMPEMDGMEALPLIRAAAPSSRVLILTGFTSAALRERALDGGACDFIEKGLPSAALVEAVRAACAR
jgi:DNA-binding NarL/FixJ family response regulator